MKYFRTDGKILDSKEDKILKDKIRNHPIQKFKIGQWVYIYHENILQRALISGVLFDYNHDLTKVAFERPQYKVEIDLGSRFYSSVFVYEHQVFKTKEECVAYALEHGLVKEER